MFSFLLPKRFKIRKSALPNPNLEYRIIFKKGAVGTIKQAKGWRSDAEMARALGLTRQYISMLHKTRVGITSTVITRISAQMGNTQGNWHIFYEIVPYGVNDSSHPVWNQEKYMGRIPYDRYSTSGEFRKLDYNAETKD